jgi:hypothetical protein
LNIAGWPAGKWNFRNRCPANSNSDVLPEFVRSFIPKADWREPILMPLGLDDEREYRFLAQCLARLQPMQTVHEDEALAIAPD